MAYNTQGVTGSKTSTNVDIKYYYGSSYLKACGIKAKIYYDQKYDIEANKSQVSLYIDFITDGQTQQGIYWLGNNVSAATTTSGLYINGNLIAPMSYYTGNDKINIVDGSAAYTARYQHSNNGSSYSNWTYSFIVNHNADGTGSFTMELKDVAAVHQSSTHSTPTPMSLAVQTIALTTIPRTSSISATNANIGSASTIIITRNSSSFTHTVQYKITGQNSFTTIYTKTSDVSKSWTIPTAAYDYVGASAKSVVITLKCITYSGNTEIGNSTTTLTAYTVESECKPTLTKTYTLLNDTSSLTGNNTTAILNWSNVRITLSATGKHNATISSYTIIHNGDTHTGNTKDYSKIEVNTFTCRATDSRGYTTESVLTIPSVSYFKPTITPKTTNPNINTGNSSSSASGKVFTGSFGSANNSVTVQYRYKVDGGSYGSWTNLTVSTTTNKYTTSTSTIQLDYTKKYIFQMRITDSLQTVTSSAYEVITIPVFSWSKSDFQFNVKVLLANASYGSTLPQSGVEGQVFIKI